MRILRIHPFLRSEPLYPYAGGMARTSLRLTEELLRAGHDLLVFPFPDTLGTSTVWDLGRGLVVRVPATVIWPGWRRIASCLRSAGQMHPRAVSLRARTLDAMALGAFARVLREFHPQVIHNHLARRQFPRLYEALHPKIPLILTHHHGQPGESLESYDRVVFVSRAQMNLVRETVALREEAVRVVYNPVAQEFREVRVLPSRERQGVVYAGQLRHRKGVDLLLEAFALHPELRSQDLLLCGEGILDSSLSKLIEEEKLHVRLLGKLSREDLSVILAGARIMVVPSRVEGWSAAINEAICCGTPVVGYAPQILELREVLGTQVGAPFDANHQSAGELAEAVLQTLESPLQETSRREDLAARARAVLSGEKFVEGYERIYREVVQ